jgi:predicted amidophosphoribosyltransferase
MHLDIEPHCLRREYTFTKMNLSARKAIAIWKWSNTSTTAKMIHKWTSTIFLNHHSNPEMIVPEFIDTGSCSGSPH